MHRFDIKSYLVEYLLVFALFSEAIESVTERSACLQSNQVSDKLNGFPLMKKRMKRFLYPQLLILNLGNSCGSCSCNCRNRLGYGMRLNSIQYIIISIRFVRQFLGTTYGTLNQIRNDRKSRYLVQRKHLMRAQPVRKNIFKPNGNQNKDKEVLQRKKNFGS